MACPTEDQLLDFAEGRLAPAALPELEAHLDGCDSCRGALGALQSKASLDPAYAATVVEKSQAPAERSGLGGGSMVGRYLVIEQIGAGGVTTDEDRDHFHRDHRGPRDHLVSRGRFFARSDSAGKAQGRSARR